MTRNQSAFLGVAIAIALYGLVVLINKWPF